MVQAEAQQAIVERLTKVCFERCVPGPADGRLGDKQRRCLDACSGAFLEGYGVAVSVAPGSAAGGSVCLRISGPTTKAVSVQQSRCDVIPRSHSCLLQNETFGSIVKKQASS